MWKSSAGFLKQRIVLNRVNVIRWSRLHSSPALFSSLSRKYKYFQDCEIRDGVAVIKIDCPDSKVNTINNELREEIEKYWVECIESNPDIKATVFLSAKKDCFIAGADVNMIKAIEDKSSLKEICLAGHKTFKLMKSKGIPVVAGIDGSCLGGGLEWAMHCDYRIATTNKKTVLGLPEVKLGLLPGFGGTQNLPALVGLPAGLDIILTGKNVRPDKAKKLGLVDLVVDPGALENIAVEQARQLANRTLKVKKQKTIQDRIIDMVPHVRNYVFDQASKTVTKSTGGKYPAPYKILECVKKGYEVPRDKALEFEATKFSELAATPESAALIGLFDGTVHLKKNRFGPPQHRAQTVAVLGAGLMGAGIAQISSEKGFEVFLKDRNVAGVGRGEQYLRKEWEGKVKKRRMTKYESTTALSRVHLLHDGPGVGGAQDWTRHMGRADMVIEAVFEELGVKHQVIEQVEPHLPPHAVFATNTSAIPIAHIATAAKRPENVIGLHYFSPVPKMPLLEIIPHAGTAQEAKSVALDVGQRQGKTCIVVKDVPGFYVNRCLGPYLVESCALVAEGVPLDRLDQVMKTAGLPVGPLTLADEVGIDVANHVQSFLSAADLGCRMDGGDTRIMAEMVKRGMLGRKSGKGFFIHPAPGGKGKGKGKAGGGGAKQINPEVLELIKPYLNAGPAKATATSSTSTVTDEDIVRRMIGRFTIEALYCLQDGVIESPVDGDIGAVFGIGFLPFTGGPFRMVDAYPNGGLPRWVDEMAAYADKYGEQFRPPQMAIDMAKAGKKFF